MSTFNRRGKRTGAKKLGTSFAGLPFAGLLGFLFLLWLGATPALAVPDTYFKIGEFGDPTVGSGPGQFNVPRSAAVDDANGNILVVDSGNNRVQVYAPTGSSATLLTEFGSGVLSSPYGIAVDQSDGSVYVSDSGNNRIVKFESNGAATPSYAVDASFVSPPQGSCGGGDPCVGQVGSFAAPLAVDPTTGELLVGDPGNAVVDRYKPDGTFVSAFDGAGAPAGNLSELESIAVDDVGRVFVAHSKRVDLFSAAGAFVLKLQYGTPSETSDEFPSARVAGGTVVSFDPNTGYTLVGSGFGGSLDETEQVNVYVFDGTTLLSRIYFDPAEGLGGVSAYGLFGLAVDGGGSAGGGRVYAVFSKVVEAFGDNGVAVLRSGTAPAVTMDPPSGISEDDAHLSGSVNPNGSTTSWHFEWSADGSTWFQSPIPAGDAGNGSGPVSVGTDIGALQPNTTYHVRFVAESEVARRTTPEQTFVTTAGPPTVLKAGAAPVLDTTARLNARVNPNGLATAYHFEYGLDGSYGNSVPADQDADAGAGTELVLTAREISDLQPNTVYHYRLVAENAVGVTHGPDTVFRTRSPAELALPTRGVELVNEPDKGFQNVLEAGISADGNRMYWTVPSGTPSGTNGGTSIFVADRTPTGWKSHNLIPPPAEQFEGGYQTYQLANWSPSMDRFLVLGKQGILAASPYALATIDPAGKQRSLFTFEPLPQAPRPYVSSDLSHIIAATDQPIDPRHAPGEITHVYEFGDGTPELLDLMPDGSVPSCGVGLIGFGKGIGYSWISSDASQIYFSTQGDDCQRPYQLYVRHRDTGVTEKLSGPPVSGPEGEAFFIRTTPDGGEALFDSVSRLTRDDGNSTADIYRYRRGKGIDCITCVVPNASVIYSPANAGDPVAAVSDDLKYVYFTSRNVLVQGEGKQGDLNLYVWHDGEIKYVSPSGAGDVSSLSHGGYSLADGGAVLFFPSDAAGITADDNNHQIQYYRFDFRTKAIECVTCGRSGKVPDFGAAVPESDPTHSGNSAVTADGNTFVFETEQALLRRDVNSGPDIYEWHNGSLGLVTDGTTSWPISIGRLQLKGISPDGSSVAFVGAASLTGYEHDSVGQLFVARRDGGFGVPPIPPAPCAEDACQGPLQAAPSLAAPGSASFVGPGNEHAAKQKKKKHRRQHKKKRRQGKKRTAHKAHKGRAAK